MDIYQTILLINLCVSYAYFIISMIFLKASGINPMGKRVKTKNKFGVLSIIISTLILYSLWIIYIIDTNTILLFFSLELMTKSDYVKWTAVVIMTIATIIEIISGLTLGKSGRIHSPAEKIKLVKNGMYGIIRNPIVSGMFLYGFGILLLNPNILGLLMIILMIFGYNFKVDTEAKKLEEMFGNEWNDYCKRTGKYFPKLFTKGK
ncbi:MAG: isoprenylcysteine carboxylmethyltransferase family protein [Spirochaetales bacterium]|nr:isoprenylcysteine carboxylmethyltransferase family protein [Spirochaetales bacterium]